MNETAAQKARVLQAERDAKLKELAERTKEVEADCACLTVQIEALEKLAAEQPAEPGE